MDHELKRHVAEGQIDHLQFSTGAETAGGLARSLADVLDGNAPCASVKGDAALLELWGRAQLVQSTGLQYQGELLRARLVAQMVTNESRVGSELFAQARLRVLEVDDERGSPDVHTLEELGDWLETTGWGQKHALVCGYEVIKVGLRINDEQLARRGLVRAERVLVKLEDSPLVPRLVRSHFLWESRLHTRWGDPGAGTAMLQNSMTIGTRHPRRELIETYARASQHMQLSEYELAMPLLLSVERRAIDAGWHSLVRRVSGELAVAQDAGAGHPSARRGGRRGFVQRCR